MSTYVLMKILESAPSRYDLGIRILTLGSVEKAYDRLASSIAKGQRVLDIGCGTGALALRAARKGAFVKGIDINPSMLEIAERKAREMNLSESPEFSEMGVAELGSEPAQAYDVVMGGLSFSELTDSEMTYTLKQIERILKPGGILLVADEAAPESIIKRLLGGLFRLPLAIITYLVTQTSTRAVRHLPSRVKGAGLEIESVRTGRLGTFIELQARKPGRSSNE